MVTADALVADMLRLKSFRSMLKSTTPPIEIPKKLWDECIDRYCDNPDANEFKTAMADKITQTMQPIIEQRLAEMQASIKTATGEKKE